MSKPEILTAGMAVQQEWPAPSLVDNTSSPVPSLPLTPMDLMQRALEAGNLDLVERMMSLQERWEQAKARKAFDAAIAAAGAEMPVIFKNREAGKMYRYEDFASIARAIDPVLAKHGLRYRFRTVSGDKTLTVVCILSHRDGHSEENSLTAPFDVGQNRNALQAIGSSQTYLQRYTLKAALGLASSQDDDARSAHQQTGELLSDDQIAEIRSLIVQSGADIKKFCDTMKVDAIENIYADEFKTAKAKLQQKIEFEKKKKAAAQ